jgi:hypothetical protein
MPRIGKNSDCDFSAGQERLPPNTAQLSSDLRQLLANPDTWGEPPSYVELLTDPSVRSRIAKLIVHSALKRPRRGR